MELPILIKYSVASILLYYYFSRLEDHIIEFAF